MTVRIRHHDILRLLVRYQGLRPALTRLSAHQQIQARIQSSRPRLQALSTSATRNQDRPDRHGPDTRHHLPPPPAVVAEPQSPIVASKPKPKTGRAVRRLIFAATFLLVGTVAGSVLRVVVHPPDPAVPGTEKDRITTEILHKEAEKLPVFQTLSADPAWESWDAYNTLTPEHRAQHIAAGAMGGSRGVGGYQRIFYKASTGELTSVIYFGHSITGWPGVVHGGAIATILDESCGRAAFKQWGGMSGMTANLKLAYIRPTRSDNFYLVRVRPVPDDELPEEDRGKRHYKSFVDASVEEARTGNVAVVAKALFVGGSGKDGKASHGKWKGSGLDENARF